MGRAIELYRYTNKRTNRGLNLKYNPTLIFVEHDTTFVEKVATKIITIEK